MEVNKEMGRNDFLLTATGIAMLKDYRLSGEPVRGRIEGWEPPVSMECPACECDEVCLASLTGLECPHEEDDHA